MIPTAPLEMPTSLAPYTLIHGASWLLPDGSIHIVKGFHEEWIQEHQDLAGDCANVCELVLKKGWISVAVFSGGYVELMIDDAAKGATLGLAREFLARNEGEWSSCLVMTLIGDGYAQVKPADIREPGLFEARVRAGEGAGC